MNLNLVILKNNFLKEIDKMSYDAKSTFYGHSILLVFCVLHYLIFFYPYNNFLKYQKNNGMMLRIAAF